MKIKLFVLILFLSISLFPQNFRNIKSLSSNSEDEIVSLSASLPMNQALQLLSKVSKKVIDKIIVGGDDITTPIGIEILSMNWYKALEIISKYNNCEFVETESYIKFFKKSVSTETVPDVIKGVNLNTREVNISAIFFELDVIKSKESGLNWKFLLSSNDLSIGSKFGNVSEEIFGTSTTTSTSTSTGTGGTQTQDANNFGIGAKSSFKLLDFLGKATAIFNFYEKNQMGEIIASPQITVRDRMKGDIQVGSDYSTREKDFSGNTVEKFFSTGSIIKVTPYVLEQDGKKFIAIELEVERSSAIPGTITTEIKRTKAATKVLLLDGEETVIGGLYVNEEKTERNGIPFFKDLPWWVLGIRYLTGYDINVLTKKELIIVLKAQLVPTLQERLEMTKENLIKKEHEKNQETIKFYQFDHDGKNNTESEVK